MCTRWPARCVWQQDDTLAGRWSVSGCDYTTWRLAGIRAGAFALLAVECADAVHTSKLSVPCGFLGGF